MVKHIKSVSLLLENHSPFSVTFKKQPRDDTSVRVCIFKLHLEAIGINDGGVNEQMFGFQLLLSFNVNLIILI